MIRAVGRARQQRSTSSARLSGTPVAAEYQVQAILTLNRAGIMHEVRVSGREVRTMSMMSSSRVASNGMLPTNDTPTGISLPVHVQRTQVGSTQSNAGRRQIVSPGSLVFSSNLNEIVNTSGL